MCVYVMCENIVQMLLEKLFCKLNGEGATLEDLSLFF